MKILEFKLVILEITPGLSGEAADREAKQQGIDTDYEAAKADQ